MSLAHVAAAAAAMTETAGNIPDALTGIQMEQEQRRQFIALANQLQQQALNLYRVAARDNLPSVTRAMEPMTATCKACHATFRGTGAARG